MEFILQRFKRQINRKSANSCTQQMYVTMQYCCSQGTDALRECCSQVGAYQMICGLEDNRFRLGCDFNQQRENYLWGWRGLSSDQHSYLCFLMFVFRYLSQYPEEHQSFFRFIWSRDLSRNCRATEQRQKMMTSGRFKVMFNNDRYNKSLGYSELILTDNKNQKSFASVL